MRIIFAIFCFAFILTGVDPANGLTGCPGDGTSSTVVTEYVFDEGAGGTAANTGTDGGSGDATLTNGVTFSIDLPPIGTNWGWSASLPNAGTGATTPAIQTAGSYDPLAGATKFTAMAWIRRQSVTISNNTAARIVSDISALGATASGFEFRFSGTNGVLMLNINGTERNTTVGGILFSEGNWHHVAVVYDGTRPATNTLTRHVHFYVDGVQRGDGNTLASMTVGTNTNRLTVGNSAVDRGVLQAFVGKIDDVRILRGFAPDAVGNGKTNSIISCYMNSGDLGGDTDGDGLADCEELYVYGTDPQNPDTDGDGMPDGWEVQHGLNPLNAADAAVDMDGDGLTNLAEYQHGTDPRDTDTDSDWLSDGDEVNVYGTNPTLPDTDGDRYEDGEEVLNHGSDPIIPDPDQDQDHVPDAWETAHGLDPNDPEDIWNDHDSDGLSNIEEFWYGTDPQSVDTDGDGYSDGDEVNVYGTDPRDANSYPGGLAAGSSVSVASGSSVMPSMVCDKLDNPSSPGGKAFGMVEAGKRYLTRAKGLIAFNLDDAFADPDGNRRGTQSGRRDPAGPGFLCPSQAGYSLVGKVAGGSCFQLGSCRSFTSSADGLLTLHFNDDVWPDNSGAWDVCVIPDNFKITLMTFIPEDHVETPGPTFNCLPCPPFFGGDERSWANESGGLDLVIAEKKYRSLQAVEVTTQGIVPGTDVRDVGTTTGYADNAVVGGSLLPAAKADTILGDCDLKHAVATGNPNQIRMAKWEGKRSNVIKVRLKGKPRNPLCPFCAINWDNLITIDTSCNGTTLKPRWRIDFDHDQFPNHEVYINSQRIYEFPHGPNPLLLCGPAPNAVGSRDGELE